MLTVLESLNAALHRTLEADERVYLLGEDILDPYGGAFKVTQGLSAAFSGRVWSTPVSEAGIMGIAAGMALRGLRPVVEVMFGDFLTLAADQLVNHIAKFRWMYDDQVSVPVVIRVPMGGRRGYGPTHSQTLEKLFLGIPGLRTLAHCMIGDPGALLEHAILHDEDPVLFVENKLLYLAELLPESGTEEFAVSAFPGIDPANYGPAYTLSIRGAPEPSITLAAYGYMSELGRQAVARLAYEEEIFCELVILTQLAPFDVEPFSQSLSKTGRLLVLEESTQTLGWGAEILARLLESSQMPSVEARRLGGLDLPIPASAPLEARVLPSVEAIVQAARKMV